MTKGRNQGVKSVQVKKVVYFESVVIQSCSTFSRTAPSLPRKQCTLIFDSLPRLGKFTTSPGRVYFQTLSLQVKTRVRGHAIAFSAYRRASFGIQFSKFINEIIKIQLGIKRIFLKISRYNPKIPRLLPKTGRFETFEVLLLHSLFWTVTRESTADLVELYF